MQVPTLLRNAEHKALGKLVLSGSVLDLGGDTNAAYRKIIKGNCAITSVNADRKTLPDVTHDLEHPLPFPDATYDHVLLINVLEHIYNYRQLLAEASRVVKPAGSVVIVVPFLFPVHLSPHDYWRFTHETLRKECEAVGLSVEEVLPLGGGVFSAAYVLFDRLMPTPIRLISFWTIRYGVAVLDLVTRRVATFFRKKYNPADYALGYYVVAHPQS